MKTKILLILILFSIVKINAQETFGSAGQQISNSTANVNFTVGETIINELHLDSTTILNGYHQPIIKVKPIDIHETENWNVSVFPNPTQDFLNIKWNNPDIENLSYKLISIDGKLVKQGQGNEFIKLNIQDVASGNYYLYLNNKEKSQTYQIQKIK